TQGVFSFPPGGGVFKFAGLPPPGLFDSTRGVVDFSSRVCPFGHLRIDVCSRLPGAFRTLPRPSSALGAKASTSCPVELGPPTSDHSVNRVLDRDIRMC